MIVDRLADHVPDPGVGIKSPLGECPGVSVDSNKAVVLGKCVTNRASCALSGEKVEYLL
jgi:hypothetical protein